MVSYPKLSFYSISEEYVIGILIGIAWNLLITLGAAHILIFFLYMNTGYLFVYLYLFQFFSSVFIVFRSFTSLRKFIPKYF